MQKIVNIARDGLESYLSKLNSDDPQVKLNANLQLSTYLSSAAEALFLPFRQQLVDPAEPDNEKKLDQFSKFIRGIIKKKYLNATDQDLAKILKALDDDGSGFKPKQLISKLQTLIPNIENNETLEKLFKQVGVDKSNLDSLERKSHYTTKIPVKVLNLARMGWVDFAKKMKGGYDSAIARVLKEKLNGLFAAIVIPYDQLFKEQNSSDFMTFLRKQFISNYLNPGSINQLENLAIYIPENITGDLKQLLRVMKELIPNIEKESGFKIELEKLGYNLLGEPLHSDKGNEAATITAEKPAEVLKPKRAAEKSEAEQPTDKSKATPVEKSNNETSSGKSKVDQLPDVSKSDGSQSTDPKTIKFSDVTSLVKDLKSAGEGGQISEKKSAAIDKVVTKIGREADENGKVTAEQLKKLSAVLEGDQLAAYTEFLAKANAPRQDPAPTVKAYETTLTLYGQRKIRGPLGKTINDWYRRFVNGENAAYFRLLLDYKIDGSVDYSKIDLYDLEDEVYAKAVKPHPEIKIHNQKTYQQDSSYNQHGRSGSLDTGVDFSVAGLEAGLSTNLKRVLMKIGFHNNLKRIESSVVTTDVVDFDPPSVKTVIADDTKVKIQVSTNKNKGVHDSYLNQYLDALLRDIGDSLIVGYYFGTEKESTLQRLDSKSSSLRQTEGAVNVTVKPGAVPNMPGGHLNASGASIRQDGRELHNESDFSKEKAGGTFFKIRAFNPVEFKRALNVVINNMPLFIGEDGKEIREMVVSCEPHMRFQQGISFAESEVYKLLERANKLIAMAVTATEISQSFNEDGYINSRKKTESDRGQTDFDRAQEAAANFKTFYNTELPDVIYLLLERPFSIDLPEIKMRIDQCKKQLKDFTDGFFSLGTIKYKKTLIEESITMGASKVEESTGHDYEGKAPPLKPFKNFGHYLKGEKGDDKKIPLSDPQQNDIELRLKLRKTSDLWGKLADIYKTVDFSVTIARLDLKDQLRIKDEKEIKNVPKPEFVKRWQEDRLKKFIPGENSIVDLKSKKKGNQSNKILKEIPCFLVCYIEHNAKQPFTVYRMNSYRSVEITNKEVIGELDPLCQLVETGKEVHYHKDQLPTRIVQWLFDKEFLPPYFHATVDLELVFGYMTPNNQMKMVSREASFELAVSEVELNNLEYLDVGDVIHYRGGELTRDLAVDDSSGDKKGFFRNKTRTIDEIPLFARELGNSNLVKNGVVLYLKKTKLVISKNNHMQIPKSVKKFKLEISQIAEVHFKEGITNSAIAGQNFANEAISSIAKKKAEGRDISTAEQRVLDESLELNFFNIMRAPGLDWVKINQALDHINATNILAYSDNIQNDIIISLVDCVEKINKEKPVDSDKLILLIIHVFINSVDILTDKNNGAKLVRFAISWLANANKSVREASNNFLYRCVSDRYEEVGLSEADFQGILPLFDSLKSVEDALELFDFIRAIKNKISLGFQGLIFDKILALISNPDKRWDVDYHDNSSLNEALKLLEELLISSKNAQFIVASINKIFVKALEREKDRYLFKGLSRVLNILSDKGLENIMSHLRFEVLNLFISLMIAKKVEAKTVGCILGFYDEFCYVISKYLVPDFNCAPMLEKLVVEVRKEFEVAKESSANKYYLESLLYVCRRLGGYLESFYSCNDKFKEDVTKASQLLIVLFSGEANELGKKLKIDPSIFLKVIDSFCRIKKIKLVLDRTFILSYLSCVNLKELLDIKPRKIESKMSERDNVDHLLELMDYYPHLFTEMCYIEALSGMFNQLSDGDASQLDYKSWILDILFRICRTGSLSLSKEQYNTLLVPSALNFTSEPHCLIVETLCELGIRYQIEKIPLLENILINIFNEKESAIVSRNLSLLENIEAVDLINYFVRRVKADTKYEESLINGLSKTLAILSVNYALGIELKTTGNQLEYSQKSNGKTVEYPRLDIDDVIRPHVDKLITAYNDAEKQEKRLSSLVRPKEVTVLQERRSSYKRDAFLTGYVSNKYRVMFQYPSDSFNAGEECLKTFRTDRKSILESLIKPESRKTILEKNPKLFTLLIYEYYRQYLLSSSTTPSPNETKGLAKIVDSLRSKTSAPAENSALMLACVKLAEALKNKHAMKEPDARVIDLCSAAEKELGEQIQGKVYEDYLNSFQDEKKPLSIGVLVCFAILKELPCRVWFKSEDVLTLYSSNAVQEGSNSCTDFMLIGGSELAQVTDFSQYALLVPVPISSQRAQINVSSRPLIGLSSQDNRFFSRSGRKVSRNWQLQKFKLPNQDLEVLDVNVPGDNTCLFYSVALGYLLPVLGDNLQFKSRIDALFKLNDDVIEYEKLQKILSTFEGQADFISRVDDSGFLEALVNVNLRAKIVAYMRDQSHYDEFLDHYRDEFYSVQELSIDALRARFDNYLDDMQESKGLWGGTLEILACIQLLNVDFNIYVISKNGADLEPTMTADKSNPKPNGEINLFYTSMIVGGARNHYHVLIDPKDMPNSDEKLTSGIEPPRY